MLGGVEGGGWMGYRKGARSMLTGPPGRQDTAESVGETVPPVSCLAVGFSHNHP